LNFNFFSPVLGIKPRAFHMLGKHFNHPSHAPSPLVSILLLRQGLTNFAWLAWNSQFSGVSCVRYHAQLRFGARTTGWMEMLFLEMVNT
jgi:hypothetical protein